jgi:hypothetical protein
LELGCRENLTVRLGEVEVFTSGVPGRVAIAVGNFERGLSDSVCSCINAVKKRYYDINNTLIPLCFDFATPCDRVVVSCYTL